jgi:hypothetical protein
MNENRPLRLLICITRLYEKTIESLGKNKIYREKLVKNPRPELYVFYNGIADYPSGSLVRSRVFSRFRPQLMETKKKRN